MNTLIYQEQFVRTKCSGPTLSVMSPWASKTLQCVLGCEVHHDCEGSPQPASPSPEWFRARDFSLKPWGLERFRTHRDVRRKIRNSIEVGELPGNHTAKQVTSSLIIWIWNRTIQRNEAVVAVQNWTFSTAISSCCFIQQSSSCR